MSAPRLAPFGPDSNTSAGSPHGTAPGFSPIRSVRKNPSFEPPICETISGTEAGCMLFVGRFCLVRFHPCALDILWLVSVNLFLKLHKSEIIPDRYVLAVQGLLELENRLVNCVSPAA